MNTRTLAAAYENTQYRVRLPRGGHATIRIGQALPGPLHDLLPDADAPWAFVTAWNPQSVRQAAKRNRASQRRLIEVLRRQPEPTIMNAGVGVGTHMQWREPSLFVVGVSFERLDELMRPFRQHAIVRGRGISLAELHWMD